MTLKSILKEAQKLSLDERIVLTHELWASVEKDGEEAPVSSDLKAELKSRVAYIKEHPDAWIPWEKVKAEIKSRRPK